MSQEVEKRKRKRSHAEHGDERPKKQKKVQIEEQNIKVQVVEDIGEWMPVVATTQGLQLQGETVFKTYRVEPPTDRSGEDSGLILHSTSHRRLDYTARQEGNVVLNAATKNYVGVYDPSTGDLKVVPAGHVTVRGGLRAAKPEKQDEEEKKPLGYYAARTALGEEFGTKKAKKAIRSRAQNAVGAFFANGTDESAPISGATEAALQSLAQSRDTKLDPKEIEAALAEAHPRPTPNISAENPAAVYDLDEMCGGLLGAMDTSAWRITVKGGKQVDLKSRFVAHRLDLVVGTGDERKLKAHKFLYVLLQWNDALKSVKWGSKRVPKKEELQEAMPGIERAVVDGIRKKFAPEGLELNSVAQDRLNLHICAIALYIDNFCMDVCDIGADLKLDQTRIRRYFHELGCKVNPPSEKSRIEMKISKAEALAHSIAALQVPLELPKLRTRTQRQR